MMEKILISSILCLAVFGTMVNGQCKEANGTYPVSGSCDAYIQCKNGVAEEQLCPDGLLYNQKSSGYPCGYPIDVQCEQPQARLQAPQSTEECPHQFGYYPMGDSSHCGQFKNCASGRGFVFDCPEGLAWNKETYKCDWPDQVPDCDAEKFLGFRCPAPPTPVQGGLLGEQEQEYTFHASPNNCQKYFICIEGSPRLVGCDESQAFNPEINGCDDIENVPTCSPEIKQRGQEVKNARLAAAKNQPRSVTADAECPDPNGRFADPEQCDAYTECIDGEAEDKLCPDGLLFHQRTKSRGDCTYAPFTTCKDRTKLQPANGTAECPRQFGFYTTGDRTKCGIYKNCAHGEATFSKCPEGLAFNVATYQCDWPDLVEECDAEAYLGFKCPAVEQDSEDQRKAAVDVGPEGTLHYFRHPNSCKKYFVCVNGQPRLYSCQGKSLAFNSETKLCDFYTHVPECFDQARRARPQARAEEVKPKKAEEKPETEEESKE